MLEFRHGVTLENSKSLCTMGLDACNRSEVIEENIGGASRENHVLRPDPYFQEINLTLHSRAFWEHGACGES